MLSLPGFEPSALFCVNVVHATLPRKLAYYVNPYSLLLCVFVIYCTLVDISVQLAGFRHLGTYQKNYQVLFGKPANKTNPLISLRFYFLVPLTMKKC